MHKYCVLSLRIGIAALKMTPATVGDVEVHFPGAGIR
jgi:hypothetical protein